MEEVNIVFWIMAASWLTAAVWIGWALLKHLPGKGKGWRWELKTGNLQPSIREKDVIEQHRRRRVAVISGLTCAGIAVLAAPSIYSEYSLHPEHLLSHSMYKALIVLCAISLIRVGNPAKNPGILGRLKNLDLNTFDAFQYALARRTQSLANSIRRIHTGNLNLNMLGFLVGFIICLLFLLSSAFF